MRSLLYSPAFSISANSCSKTGFRVLYIICVFLERQNYVFWFMVHSSRMIVLCEKQSYPHFKLSQNKKASRCDRMLNDQFNGDFLNYFYIYRVKAFFAFFYIKLYTVVFTDVVDQ